MLLAKFVKNKMHVKN